MRRRRGFALLAALWVIVGLSVLALTGLLAARGVVIGAENRIAIMRGTWRAEDCLARARSAIDDAMVAGGWNVLDRAALPSPAVTEARCDVTLVPTGLAVDVNAADAEQLRALLGFLQIAGPTADSMVDALLDWRDADDIPRPFGAEAAWYRAAGRFPPRNGPLADIRELRRVRGFDERTVPDSVLNAVFTVEPGRIVWSRASLAVLASVPGMSEEALGVVAERRTVGASISGLTDVSARLSPAAKALFDNRWSDVQRVTTDQPDAWILTARGGPTTIEVRLASAGARAAIIRRRTWP